MKTATIEQLAGYLPYGLNVMIISQPLKGDIHKLSGINYDGLASLGNAGRFGFIQRGFKEFKPLLRPLSDLTKPIKDAQGETVTPILELAKIS